MTEETRQALTQLVAHMDATSGEQYVQAHAETLALVRSILDTAGLSIKLGKSYSSAVTRKPLRRVDFYRANGEHARTVDVPNGPAAYVRARAILAVAS